ncbi:hypothetical protein F4775DRAFT_548955 [Biscogniauxia sp. FL1348]|nr:hypothetical protein F4775DRAFT_548955 [Biscogniauxia sp. FL1348]
MCIATLYLLHDRQLQFGPSAARSYCSEVDLRSGILFIHIVYLGSPSSSSSSSTSSGSDSGLYLHIGRLRLKSARLEQLYHLGKYENYERHTLPRAESFFPVLFLWIHRPVRPYTTTATGFHVPSFPPDDGECNSAMFLCFPFSFPFHFPIPLPVLPYPTPTYLLLPSLPFFSFFLFLLFSPPRISPFPFSLVQLPRCAKRIEAMWSYVLLLQTITTPPPKYRPKLGIDEKLFRIPSLAIIGHHRSCRNALVPGLADPHCRVVEKTQSPR